MGKSRCTGEIYADDLQPDIKIGMIIHTARGAATLIDILVGKDRAVFVVEFVSNIGNNHPDTITVDSEYARRRANIASWRPATSDEIRESVEARRRFLERKFVALLQAAAAMDGQKVPLSVSRQDADNDVPPSTDTRWETHAVQSG